LDSGSDWRVIDAAADEAKAEAQATPASEKTPRWLIGGLTAIVLAAVGVAIWATLPSGGATVEGATTGAALAPRGVVDVAGSVRPASVAPVGVIVVDIEGAVAAPGVHHLTTDARIGDAIEAAGGYAANADIEAAARTLNLAAKLTDGQQIRVPALGDATAASYAPPGGGPDGSVSGSGGLVDINHAMAEELDTLPGIGPVTAQKIIDARAEEPFATVDELESRGVLGPSTFDKLRDLITVTP
jgi:competence protein ComEA